MAASMASLRKNSLVELSRLASSASGSDDAPLSCIEIVREGIGAESLSIVYGDVEEGFRALAPAAIDDLSQNALWLVNRDAMAATAPRGFRVQRGRVSDFVDISARRSFDRIAYTIPIPGSVGQMLVARGEWPRGLSRPAVEFLVAAAPATALVLQRWLRVSEAKRDRDQLAALIDITKGLSGNEDLEQWLRNLAYTIGVVAGLDYVTIDLLAPAGSVRMRCVNYELTEFEGQTDRWLNAANRPDPIRQAVIASRQPALFPDAERDERLPARARSFFTRMLIRSTAMFPMVARDEVLGVLSVGSTRPLAFDEQEVQLIEGMAAQASTAIKGIELYRELAESRAKLAQKSDLLERALESERDQARRDSLTGVFNHGAIASKLRELAERSSAAVPFAAAMVDVDGMKATNDTYGHLVGDMLLMRLASTLQSERAIVGRYGGDEFLVILPCADRDRAEEYRNSVLARLADEYVVDADSGARIPVVASIGLAVYPDEADQVEDVIKLADTSMYGLRSERRHELDPSASQSFLQGERAAKLVGDIVPLLTAPGTRDEKLILVAQR